MTKFIDRHLENFLGPIAGATEKKAEWEPFVYFFEGTPFENCVTYSTLGLSDHILELPNNRTVRLELVLPIESAQKHDSFGGLLTYVAEKIIKSHTAPLRGEVICLNHKLIPGSTCSELYVSNPVVFPEGFAASHETSPPTVFIWLIPITQSELEYVSTHGWSKFEDLLEEKDPNLFNMYRPSILE